MRLTQDNDQPGRLWLLFEPAIPCTQSMVPENQPMIIGLSIGAAALLVIIGAVVSLTIPRLRKIVFPFSQRKEHVGVDNCQVSGE